MAEKLILGGNKHPMKEKDFSFGAGDQTFSRRTGDREGQPLFCLTSPTPEGCPTGKGGNGGGGDLKRAWKKQ